MRGIRETKHIMMYFDAPGFYRSALWILRFFRIGRALIATSSRGMLLMGMYSAF